MSTVQLPHAHDAEKALLGSILLDPEVAGDVLPLIPRSEYFHDKRHQLLYDLLLELIDTGKPVELLTVTEELTSRQLLDEAGGRTYVMDLLAVDHAGHAQYYAKIVHDRALVRRLIGAGQEIVRASLEEGNDIERLVDHCEAALYEVSESSGQAEAHSIDELVAEAWDDITEMMESGGQHTSGTLTGFHEMDRMTSGIHPSELIILAARPSMGKTSFAVNICTQVAMQGVPVAIFSLEVARDQLVRNMLCSMAEVNSHGLRSGQLGPEDYDRLGRAAGDLGSATMFINDTPGMSVMGLRTAARRIHNRTPLGLIMIDYLQLMEGSTLARQQGRQQEVTEISRGLKSLARELKVPVMALAQLNRKVDEREDHRPRMSDLRESGSIEQEADLIMFLYRAAYYQRDDPELKNHAELIIAKQRHGPTGAVEMEFIQEHSRFRNLSDWDTAR